jgi:hypothetical protein
LVDNNGEIVDSLTYDDHLPWPVEADGAGSTLELIDVVVDNSIPANWKASIGHGTPGKLNSVVTSVEENRFVEIPSEFSLSQNYPNPFNPETRIKYQLPKTGHVSLKVYDILGRAIVTLVNETKTPGRYEVVFNGSELASGLYIYQLKSGSYVEAKKFLLLK